MRILANENLPVEAVAALRQRGHDVTWVRTDAPGSDDQAVLRRASAESRILVTFDKDFGELAFRAGVPAPSGILLFRVATTSAASVAETVAAIVESRTDWAGHFAVIEEDRIRMTPLPKSPTS